MRRKLQLKVQLKVVCIDFFKNKKRRRIAAGALAAILLATGCLTIYAGRKPSEGSAQELIYTAVIEKKDLVKSVGVTGVIASADGRAGNTGLTNLKVSQVHVKVGDEVKQGDLLCTFDSELLENSLAAARNNYEVNRKLDALGADYEKQYSDSLKQADSSLTDARKKRDQAKNAYQEASGKANTAREAAEKAAADLNAKQAACETAKKAAAAAAQAYEDRRQSAYEAARAAQEAREVQAAQAGETQDGQEGALKTDQNGGQSGETPENSAAAASESTLAETQTNAAEKTAEPLPDRTPVVINDIDAYIAGLDVNGPDYTALKDTLNAYSEARTALEQAKAEAERTRNVYEQASAEKGQAKTSFDQAQAARQEAQGTYDSSVKDAKAAYQKAKLQSQLIPDSDAKKQINQYEEQLEDYVVRAPISGVITSLSVKEGQTFAGGVIYEIQDLKHFVVEATVDEYDVVKISQGMTAYVKTNSMGEELLKGTVTYVAPTAGNGKSSTGSGSTGGTQTGSDGSPSYQIQITIDGEQEKLRPGMTAKVSIVQEESKGALSVPYDCVETKEDGTSVIYVEKDGEKKEVLVEKGMETGYYAEIRGKELKEGMTVYLPDGRKEGGQLEEKPQESTEDYGFGIY